MNGYIKIPKEFIDWEWYSDINTKVLFLHLLLKANSKDEKFFGRLIKEGQLISTIKKLSYETGLSNGQVRSSLKKLILSEEIAMQRTNRSVLITVCCYSRFQINLNHEQSIK